MSATGGVHFSVLHGDGTTTDYGLRSKKEAMTTQPPAGDNICMTEEQLWEIANTLASRAGEITALRAELAAVRVDAERYRWLREHYKRRDLIGYFDEQGILDAAIDAAIAKGKT